MARVHGRNGRLYVGIATSAAAPESLVYTSKWSMDAATDRQDVTAFGDSQKTYVAGLPDSNISFDGFWDSATAGTYTAALDGEPRKFYLYPVTPSTAGPYWYGTGFFDFSIEVDVAGAVTMKGTASAASTITKVG